MTPGLKRALLIVAATGTIMAGALACAWFVPPRVAALRGDDGGARPPPSASASGSASTSKPDAGGLIKPTVDKSILLANGHVLMPSKDFVYDWDPLAATLRKVKLGDAGPAHTSAFAPTGGRRFVVAKDSEANVRFELWDAERLVVVTELGATYGGDEPKVYFSSDGKRFMILSCHGPHQDRIHCEVGIYGLESGELVHRMHVPPIKVLSRSRVAGALSPAGNYFALSKEDFPTVAYDSAGKLVFRAHEREEADIDDEMLHFAFVDDRRLLSVSAREGVRLTDLSTGRAMTRPLFSPVLKAESLRVLTSPDRTRVATEITVEDGSFAVSIFNVDDGSGKDLPVPRSVCPIFCTMRWSSPREIVLNPNDTGAELQFRVDTLKGDGVTEPYRRPPPFEDFGVHPVHGDWDRFGTTKWHPEDRSAAHPKGALVTPKGVKLDLATIDIDRVLTSAAGDRFLLAGLDGLRLLTSDGVSVVLPTPPRPRDDTAP